MAERTLIVAASNVLARGFFAVPTDRVSTRGEPVNALFSVARALEQAIAFKAPAFAVALVDPRPGAWPEILVAQLPRLRGLLETRGFHVIETGDELALAASYAAAAAEDVVVVGTDKRLAQLVSDRVWWYDPNKDARYTVDMVVKRFEVPPPQVAEWLALVGNKDDGLPGIAGIGAKGATALLTSHGTVAAALADADAIGGRTGKALKAAAAQVPVEVARATLARDRALPVPLAQLVFVPPDPAAVNALYRELGFAELLTAEGEAPLAITLCESEADVRAIAGEHAIWAVYEDPTPIHGALVGLALSPGDGRATYVPAALIPHLAPWLADAPKLGHDLKSAIVALKLPVGGIVGDAQIASHLAQPSNWAPHDLATDAKHVLGRALPDAASVRGVGAKEKAWGALPVAGSRSTPGAARRRQARSGARSHRPSIASATPSTSRSARRSCAWSCAGSASIAPSSIARRRRSRRSRRARGQITALAGHSFTSARRSSSGPCCSRS